MGTALLLLASFAVILAGALLFTNAVEWAGRRLDLGRGGGREPAGGRRHGDAGDPDPDRRRDRGERPGADGVAIGAIIGAPFLLATIAMMLVGLSALGYRQRRRQGRPARGARPDAGTRPRLLPLLLRRWRRSSAWGRRRGCGSSMRLRLRQRLRPLRQADAPRRRRGPGGGLVPSAAPRRDHPVDEPTAT